MTNTAPQGQRETADTIMYQLTTSRHGWDEDTILESVPWADAHTWLVDLLTIWLGDNCQRCVAHAADQLPDLKALPPGSDVWVDMEGDEYFVRAVPA